MCSLVPFGSVTLCLDQRLHALEQILPCPARRVYAVPRSDPVTLGNRAFPGTLPCPHSAPKSIYQSGLCQMQGTCVGGIDSRKPGS